MFVSQVKGISNFVFSKVPSVFKPDEENAELLAEVYSKQQDLIS